ncbi:MAG: hypothetical protein ACRD12_01090, partial [Acidimicrobiales bacterium]
MEARGSDLHVVALSGRPLFRIGHFPPASKRARAPKTTAKPTKATATITVGLGADGGSGRTERTDHPSTSRVAGAMTTLSAATCACAAAAITDAMDGGAGTGPVATTGGATTVGAATGG